MHLLYCLFSFFEGYRYNRPLFLHPIPQQPCTVDNNRNQKGQECQIDYHLCSIQICRRGILSGQEWIHWNMSQMFYGILSTAQRYNN